MKKTILIIALLFIAFNISAATPTVTPTITITPTFMTPAPTLTATVTPVPTLTEEEVNYWKGVISPVKAHGTPKSNGRIETLTKTDVEVIVYQKPVAVKTAVATLVPKPIKAMEVKEVIEK